MRYQLPTPYSRNGKPPAETKKGFFSRLKTLRKNLSILQKYNLKDFFEMSYVDLSDYAWFLADIARRAKVPSVHDPLETIEMLGRSNNSFIRFGDGEIKLMEGISIPFQKAEPLLAEKLAEIVRSSHSNIKIGINWTYFHTDTFIQPSIRAWTWEYVKSNRELLLKYFRADAEYWDAGMSQLYQLYNESFNFDRYFEMVRSIWRGRDILLVCGEKSLIGQSYDVFDCANSVKKITGPTVNAWSSYQKIFDEARRSAGDRLVVTILGPAGKVLAYDLARVGIRALDMGHIAKDYNAYKTGAKKDWKALMKFFSPEV